MESARHDVEADAFSEDVLFSGHMRRMFKRAREPALRAPIAAGGNDPADVDRV